jgi:HD superfamily phosphohydrolase
MLLSLLSSTRAKWSATFKSFLQEPLFRELASTRAFHRLEQIAFLGALQYFWPTGRRLEYALSRQAHSVAVGFLAVEAARIAAVDQSVRDTLVAAALLHDIGHPPLSHSSEPFFKKEYGFGHRNMACSIILGEEPRFADTREALLDHKVDPQRVCRAINNLDRSLPAYLLNSPLNVDAIDGALRSARFFGISADHLRAKQLVRISLDPTPEASAAADLFWKTKERVYQCIYGDPASHIDSWFKARLGRQAIKRQHWEFTDEELLDRLDLLVSDAVPSREFLAKYKTRPARRLSIKPSVKLRRRKDFYERYCDTSRRVI